MTALHKHSADDCGEVLKSGNVSQGELMVMYNCLPNSDVRIVVIGEKECTDET